MFKWFTVMLLSMGVFSYSTLAEELAEEGVDSNTDSTTSASDDDDDVERIKVTGSHIKRIDSEGVSPITVIDREQLEFSGASSLGDVIRDLSFSSFGVTRKSSLSEGNGSSVTSFRGLPQGNAESVGSGGYVLILLNGKRFPSQDLNLIPITAVEQVEIITDGASAIYGSDALGGVMNFITKKGDIGYSASVGFALPEPSFKGDDWKWNGWDSSPKLKTGFKGGEEFYVSSTYGLADEDYQGIVNVMYKRDEAVFHRDRPYGRLSLENGFKDLSPFGSPGTYQLIGGELQAMPSCNTVVTQGPLKGHCGFNWSSYSQIAPDVDTFNVFSEFNFDVNDDYEVYVRFIFSHERSIGILAPPPDQLSVAKTTPEVWQAWTTAIGQPGLELVKYRMVNEPGAGTRIQNSVKNLFNLQTGFETYIGDTWDLDQSFDINGSIMNGKNKNYARMSKLLEVENGQAKWNPFKLEDQKDDITYAAYEPEADKYYISFIEEIKASGELLSSDTLGAISSAVGMRLGYEYWNTNYDEITWDKKTKKSDQWGGGSQETGNGGRDWQTLYGELLFLPEDSFEVQLAGSLDRYATSYSSWKDILKGNFVSANPKIGLKWNPHESIVFRSSAGTGFKAPGLSAIHTDSVETHEEGVDQVRCQLEGGGDSNNDMCKATQYEIKIFGNEKLQPENSIFINAGFAFQPVDQFSISLDYFFNQINNMLVNPADHIDYITKQELKAYQGDKEAKEFVKNYRVDVEPSAPRTNKSLTNMKTSFFNAGNYIASGLDLKLMLNFPLTEYTSAFFQTQSSYFLDIKYKSPGEKSKSKSQLGFYGFPYLRSNAVLGVRSKENAQLALVSQLVSPFNANQAEETAPSFGQVLKKGWDNMLSNKSKDTKNEKTKVDQMPMHITFDLVAVFPLQILNQNWSNKSNILFKVENMLNQDPPQHRKYGNSQGNIAGVSSQGVGYTPNGFYPMNGRTWRVNYSHQF